MLIKVDKANISTIASVLKKSCTTIHTLNNKPFREKNYFINLYRDLKLWITLFFIFFLNFGMRAQSSFKEEQLYFSRVREAFEQKEAQLKQSFELANLSWPPQEIFIRSFKAELELEIWVKDKNEFVLFKTYKVCKGSGNLGPKFKQGDKQVPEGIYYIDRFNPSSSYHLSLGINYPNAADLKRTNAGDPGGDIFIHGSCATIGCLPMTDEIIKEIYVLTVLAKSSGQNNIPVHIYPYRFNMLNNIMYQTFSNYTKFWKSLEEDFKYFEGNKQLRVYQFDEDGNYIFAN